MYFRIGPLVQCVMKWLNGRILPVKLILKNQLMALNTESHIFRMLFRSLMHIYIINAL